MKTGLITGIYGQGGSYLAKCLLKKGYRVVGTSRGSTSEGAFPPSRNPVDQSIKVEPIDLQDTEQFATLLSHVKPDEIYHMAAPSSVARSFLEPATTISNIVTSTSNVLEAIRNTDKSSRCFLATSTDIFGNCALPATVDTRHSPQSPYAIGKSCAHHQARVYREAYDMYVCSGIFSNFESPNRPLNYVTAKIVGAACDIKLGNASNITLGNLSIRSDWGAAEEYMQAAWLTLQQDQPDDYLFATGITSSLEKFLEIAFNFVGLDYRDYLLLENSLLRPLDIKQTLCDPSATERKLDWRAEKNLEQVIEEMILAALTKQLGNKEALALLNKQKTTGSQDKHAETA